VDELTQDDVDELVLRRAAATGRPVIAVGFTEVGQPAIYDVDEELGLIEAGRLGQELELDVVDEPE
jgi:hypothetical protein